VQENLSKSVFVDDAVQILPYFHQCSENFSAITLKIFPGIILAKML
jgi:hypothetical protein